eukprot:NODE_7278_length_778_cov_80.993893_g7037_i0.p1 GENE.NODE_7278_length_778_cov_80.993893_g7037_i0~~NODE_7278_length_778_cov_80.993893_g7037_i0.p1  ORF type:complete len:220 (+),score=49.25 NODE_7278_length_778_cov_80.993893_g7037_i0:54-662(+)
MPPRKGSAPTSKAATRAAAQRAGSKRKSEPKKSLAPATTSKSRPPTTGGKQTMKTCVLSLVADASDLLSLQAIKKALLANGFSEAAGFAKKVNKTLKALVDEDRPDFVKVGGSYHGGVDTPAFQKWNTKKQEEEALAQHQKNGHIDCGFCGTWAEHEFLGEDSIARGGSYRCDNCDKIFWAWISDGYRRGHTVEYRYGPDFC